MGNMTIDVIRGNGKTALRKAVDLIKEMYDLLEFLDQEFYFTNWIEFDRPFKKIKVDMQYFNLEV